MIKKSGFKVCESSADSIIEFTDDGWSVDRLITASETVEGKLLVRISRKLKSEGRLEALEQVKDAMRSESRSVAAIEWIDDASIRSEIEDAFADMDVHLEWCEKG